jgi:hypothetical protein
MAVTGYRLQFSKVGICFFKSRLKIRLSRSRGSPANGGTTEGPVKGNDSLNGTLFQHSGTPATETFKDFMFVFLFQTSLPFTGPSLRRR